ncbi:MAG TPA: peptidyl-prolyl cis-trans isomerase [Vicinamibacteria bacterium]|nr:peptidyl-prolyl cis-trans isomerase [Vicinamibacteria bacterium]
MSAPIRLLVVAAVLAASGRPAVAFDSTPDEPAPDAALAVVDGEPITVRQFVDELNRRSASAPGEFASATQRAALLREMVDFEVLVARARSAGYDRDPSLVAAFKRLLVGKYQSDQLEARLEQVSVTDEEITAYFEARKDEHRVPGRARVAMIFVSAPRGADERKLAAARRRAEEALAAAREVTDAARGFGAVAGRFSDDQATKFVGGAVGWLVQGQTGYRLDPAAVDAAFQLAAVGDFSGIVRGEDGFYLLRLVDRVESAVRPLSAVKEGIRLRLLQEKKARLQEQFVAEAKQAVKVEIRKGVLESIPMPAAAPAVRRPPALPGTR